MTPTVEFSLDRKRWSHKRSQSSASDSVGLIFTRSYCSMLLIMLLLYASDYDSNYNSVASKNQPLKIFLFSLMLMVSWFYLIHFTECNLGLYGNNCDKNCSCNNASCDVVTGVCDCPAGLMPPSCAHSKTFIYLLVVSIT